MNIFSGLFEFENRQANAEPVPGWYHIPLFFRALLWNPEKKSHEAIVDDPFVGVHILLDETFSKLKVSVYLVPDDLREQTWETPKAFMREDLKIHSFVIRIRGLFAREWNDYCVFTRDLGENRPVQKTENIELEKERLHIELASRIENRFKENGFEVMLDDPRKPPARGIISTLRDYYFTYLPKAARGDQRFQDVKSRIT